MSYDEQNNFIKAFPARTTWLDFDEETNKRRLKQFQNKGSVPNPNALTETAKQKQSVDPTGETNEQHIRNQKYTK